VLALSCRLDIGVAGFGGIEAISTLDHDYSNVQHDNT
jgi:hypothetical protein